MEVPAGGELVIGTVSVLGAEESGGISGVVVAEVSSGGGVDSAGAGADCSLDEDGTDAGVEHTPALETIAPRFT